jgi:hypothetical protein
MARERDPKKTYTGRRADAAVLNFTVDRSVAEKLRAYSGGPGTRRLGKFVEMLVREYEVRLQARQEERQRLQHEVLTVFDENEAAKGIPSQA